MKVKKSPGACLWAYGLVARLAQEVLPGWPSPCWQLLLDQLENNLKRCPPAAPLSEICKYQGRVSLINKLLQTSYYTIFFLWVFPLDFSCKVFENHSGAPLPKCYTDLEAALSNNYFFINCFFHQGTVWAKPRPCPALIQRQVIWIGSQSLCSVRRKWRKKIGECETQLTQVDWREGITVLSPLACSMAAPASSIATAAASLAQI